MNLLCYAFTECTPKFQELFYNAYNTKDDLDVEFHVPLKNTGGLHIHGACNYHTTTKYMKKEVMNVLNHFQI